MKTKRERFEEIASRRVQKVIDGLESLSKCSNKNNYEFTDSDIKKMMSVIRKKLKYVEDSFGNKLNNSKNEFKF